jgi:hypothetical protein
VAAELGDASSRGGETKRSFSARPEIVLLCATFLCLALIPVHILEAYGGLPAHPLLLHVPVILIPVVTIWSLLLVARPAWVQRQGLIASTVAVVALAGTILTAGAGEALRKALHLGAGGFGDTASLIARHAHAADILRLLMFAFVLVLIVYVLARRVAAGRILGRVGLDRFLSAPLTARVLATLLVALALGCGYFVFHTGDLGAKAVWANRLHGGPGGGFPFGGSRGGAGQNGGQRELFGSE